MPVNCTQIRTSADAELSVTKTPISDFQEQLAAVHPEEHQPVAEQHGSAVEKRLKARAGELEEVRAQVDAERAIEEVLP